MNEQTVIENIEDAAETLVPEIMETAQVFKTNPLLLTGVAVVSFGIGAVGGYFAAKRFLDEKYAAMAEIEIEEAKRFYAAFNKTDYATPGDAVRELIPESDELLTAAADALITYSGHHAGIKVLEDVDGVAVRTTSARVHTEEGDEVQVETEVKQTNVFVNNQAIDRDFDWDAEVAKRTEEAPYVISEGEFFQNEQDFEQWQMTYFEGDDVLINDESAVVEDVDGLVGEANLTKFGLQSKDQHMVYIKNNKRGLDFEIARSRGKYTKEVLGLEDENTRPARRRGGSEE